MQLHFFKTISLTALKSMFQYKLFKGELKYASPLLYYDTCTPQSKQPCTLTSNLLAFLPFGSTEKKKYIETIMSIQD